LGGSKKKAGWRFYRQEETTLSIRETATGYTRESCYSAGREHGTPGNRERLFKLRNEPGETGEEKRPFRRSIGGRCCFRGREAKSRDHSYADK